MIDLERRGTPMPEIISAVTTDGRCHSLYYTTDSGIGKHTLGLVQRQGDIWVFKPYKNQHFDSEELWLIMRYMIDLNNTGLRGELSE